MAGDPLILARWPEFLRLPGTLSLSRLWLDEWAGETGILKVPRRATVGGDAPMWACRDIRLPLDSVDIEIIRCALRIRII